VRYVVYFAICKSPKYFSKKMLWRWAFLEKVYGKIVIGTYMFLKRVPCGCKNFFLKSSRCFHQFEDGCDPSGIL